MRMDALQFGVDAGQSLVNTKQRDLRLLVLHQEGDIAIRHLYFAFARAGRSVEYMVKLTIRASLFASFQAGPCSVALRCAALKNPAFRPRLSTSYSQKRFCSAEARIAMGPTDREVLPDQ